MARRRDPLDVVQVIRRTRRSRPIALRTWMSVVLETRGVRAVPADAWAPPRFHYEPGDVEAKDDEGRWSHAFRWRAPGEIEVVTSAELAIARETGELDRHPIVRAARRLATKLGAELVEEERADAAIGFGAGEWGRPPDDPAGFERYLAQTDDIAPRYRLRRAADRPPVSLDEWCRAVRGIAQLGLLTGLGVPRPWRDGAQVRLGKRSTDYLFRWCDGFVELKRVPDVIEDHVYRAIGGHTGIEALCRRLAASLDAEIVAADGTTPAWATPPEKPRRGLAR